MTKDETREILKKYEEEIRGLGEKVGVDIRLEVLLAELYLNGLDPRRDVLIYPQGLFSRNYRPDVGVGEGKVTVRVAPTHIFEDDMSEEEARSTTLEFPDFLNIPVFRDGLYDYLPEGLFHKPAAKDPSDYKKEIQEQAKRQKAARRFFRPIEQEFYLQGLLLELEERKYLITEENLSRSQQGRELRDIWNIPEDRLMLVPREDKLGWTTKRGPLLDIRQLNNLLHLLPIAHRLVNQQHLVEQVFTLMLNVPVKFRTIPPLAMLIEVTQQDREAPYKLGQIEVGNFSLEGVYQDTMPALEIQIGPLNEAELTEFLPYGRSRAVLDLLISYFLPAETEIVDHLIAHEANQFIELAKEGIPPTGILGWTTYI